MKMTDVWPKEDTDFTPWLTNNIGRLDILDLGLANATREQPAGDFRIDIVAETYDQGSIVIENQYGRSDHKHFGQLLTYLAHPDQEISQGIWIVEEARPEHVRAVETLNAADNIRIWMVEVKAIRIGDSLPAPVFKLVAEPPETGLSESGSPGEGTRPELKPSQVKMQQFLGRLYENAREEGVISPFENLSPSHHGVRHTPARGQGLVYRVAVDSKGAARVVLTNKKPRDKPGTWLKAYDELKAQSDEITREFADEGLPQKLVWQDDRVDKGRWVVRYSVNANLERPDPTQLQELNRAAAAMKAVFQARIDDLDEGLKDDSWKPPSDNET